MNDVLAADVDALLDEIRRYLEAVDAFRVEGCLPSWRVEVLR